MTPTRLTFSTRERVDEASIGRRSNIYLLLSTNSQDWALSESQSGPERKTILRYMLANAILKMVIFQWTASLGEDVPNSQRAATS